MVVFLRGVNVGGHRTFRPSVLARELIDFDVVNIGAAGTFVVRRPGSRGRFRAALLRKLPFVSEIAICDGRDLAEMVEENPFGKQPPKPDVVRFVSILSTASPTKTMLPIVLPSAEEWLVRVIAARDQFIFGEYRRHMKTIGYLGQLDKLFGAPATTRQWSTIQSIVKVLDRGLGRRR